jgi:hypothetical protein
MVSRGMYGIFLQKFEAYICVEGVQTSMLLSIQGGVIVFLISSWGNNDLINDCPRGENFH